MGDNSEKNPDGSPKIDDSNYTPEYVERLKEQNKGSAMEVNVYKEVVKVQDSDDNSYLLELHESNPELAGKVSEKMGYDIDEALKLVTEAVNGGKAPSGTEAPGTFNEDDIINKAVNKIKGEEVKKYENEYFAKLPDNIKEDVQKSYKRIAGTGVKTQDEAKELLDIAFVYVNKDNKTEEKKEVIPHSSMSLGNANQPAPRPSETPAETAALAKSLGIDHLI